MTSKNKTAKAELELIEDFYQDSIQQLEEGRVDETKLGGVYSMLGRDEMDMGSLLSVLDDREDAEQLFRQAAVHLADSVQIALDRYESPEKPSDSRLANEPGKLIDAMYSAVLSGNSEIQTHIAGLATAIPRSYVSDHPELTHLYYYVRTLRAIGDEESDHIHLSELKPSLDSLSGTDHAFFSGVLRSLEGIHQREPVTLQEGIGMVLDAESPERIPEELVSIPATALLRLGRTMGLDVTVDSDRIPDTLVGK